MVAFPNLLVDQIVALLKTKNITMVADSQSSSQVGDIARFTGMHLITPTEHEARISTRDQEAGLVILAEKLKRASNAKNILLKMGEEGLLVHAEDVTNPNWLTDRVEALNSAPKDVAGAGDSLLIAAAMTITVGREYLGGCWYWFNRSGCTGRKSWEYTIEIIRNSRSNRRKMNAILLAAGYGTRLRPLTEKIPKCLVPIGNKPLLEIWLERLSQSQIRKFLINTHYMHEQVAKFVTESRYAQELHTCI
jgi:hypothetical protein